MRTAIVAVAILVIASVVYVAARDPTLLHSLSLSGSGSESGSFAKTPIWWVVDNSQVNARQWLDFGNRSTREPNEPYLKLCLDRARAALGSEFDIRPLIGRDAVYHLLGSSEDFCTKQRSIPPALWLSWCRATLLSRFGGLWMDGSVLVLPSASGLKARLQEQPVLMFGTDAAENLASPLSAAGSSVGWAAAPHHPMWAGLERDLNGLIEQGPPSWSSVEARRGFRALWDKHCSGMTTVDRVAEVGRDQYGRRLELEILLGSNEWDGGDSGMWVIFPDGQDGLDRASPWLWFTRLSVHQILESKFVWAKFARGERS